MKQQSTMQQLVQFGILVATLGMMLSLIGLYPGITGLEPKSGVGVLQILIIVAGITLLVLGALLFVKIGFYPYSDSNLAQRIALRLCLTGLLFTAAVGLSDVLGYGSNPPEGDTSFPILGTYQTLGMVIGFLTSTAGVVLFLLGGSRREEQEQKALADARRTTLVGDTGLLGEVLAQQVEIRKAQLSDAKALLLLQKQLDTETSFMMLEPEERTTTLEEQQAIIREHIMENKNRIIFVADGGIRLVGYLVASGGQYERNQHSTHVVIGVLQDYAGKGIGTRLFKAVEGWAREKQLRRLELTVMAHNERAIALYKKMGFAEEGTKKDALLVDGKYVDELYMSKILTYS